MPQGIPRGIFRLIIVVTPVDETGDDVIAGLFEPHLEALDRRRRAPARLELRFQPAVATADVVGRHAGDGASMSRSRRRPQHEQLLAFEDGRRGCRVGRDRRRFVRPERKRRGRGGDLDVSVQRRRRIDDEPPVPDQHPMDMIVMSSDCSAPATNLSSSRSNPSTTSFTPQPPQPAAYLRRRPSPNWEWSAFSASVTPSV